MKHEDIEKLLGGYATNTLTEAERNALFEAALDDQELFNALQDEENLKDLLSDEGSRLEVERALKPKPEPARGWFHFGRPWDWAIAGSLATACLVLAILVRWNPVQQRRTEVAVLKPELRPPAELRPVPPQTAANKQLLAPKPIPAAQKAVAPGSVIGSVSPPPEPAAAVPALETQAAPTVPPSVQAETSLGGPRQNAQISPSAVTSFRATQSSDMRQALKANVQEPVVSVLRADLVLSPNQPINPGDAIRFAIRPTSAGVLVLYKVGDSTPLTKEMAVEASQTYAIPDSPLSVTTEQTYRLILTAAGTVVRSWDITISPGNPVRLR